MLFLSPFIYLYQEQFFPLIATMNINILHGLVHSYLAIVKVIRFLKVCFSSALIPMAQTHAICFSMYQFYAIPQCMNLPLNLGGRGIIKKIFLPTKQIHSMENNDKITFIPTYIQSHCYHAPSYNDDHHHNSLDERKNVIFLIHTHFYPPWSDGLNNIIIILSHIGMGMVTNNRQIRARVEKVYKKMFWLMDGKWREIWCDLMARKIILCPYSVYAFFPFILSIFILIKRRWS